MADVWVIFDAPKDCQCWRDALCKHGLTWQEEEAYGGEGCRHTESYLPVYRHLGDALRDVCDDGCGRENVGHILRHRRGARRSVFVIRKSDVPLVDEHEDPYLYTQRVYAVIERYDLVERRSM